MAAVGRLHHVSVIVTDTAKSLDFYRDILGLAVNEQRPDLGYPGAWLQVGDQQIHLLELPNPDSAIARPSHAGRDRHVAFTIANLTELTQALDKAGIAYTVSHSGRRAVFCRDPDGNGCEFIENKA